MKRLLAWVATPAADSEQGKIILGAIVLDLVWSFAAILLLLSAGAQPEPVITTLEGFGLWDILIIFLLAALAEELIFRMPLSGFLSVRPPSYGVILFILLLSMVFGYAHGGWDHVPIQGGAGFIYAVVYLKCGGWQRRIGRALAASTTAHLASNLLLVFPLIVLAR